MFQFQMRSYQQIDTSTVCDTLFEVQEGLEIYFPPNLHFFGTVHVYDLGRVAKLEDPYFD